MSVLDLWLPILLAAVAVFVASSVLHMALPWHKGDWKKLPDEADILKVGRDHGLTQGQYMFPFPASMKEIGSPEMMVKWNEGPVGNMTVMPNGMPSMGKSLMQWFGFSVLISVFVAYLGSLSLPAGAETSEVFRVTATVGVLGYAFNSVVDSMWKGQSWAITLRFVVDGIVYAVATAAIFTWLWPEVAA